MKGDCYPVGLLLRLDLHLLIWSWLQVGREGMLLKGQKDEPQNVKMAIRLVASVPGRPLRVLLYDLRFMAVAAHV